MSAEASVSLNMFWSLSRNRWRRKLLRKSFCRCLVAQSAGTIIVEILLPAAGLFVQT
ncbi:hypothetical protein BDN71DRAFT_543650 [Pleurotus eryngii]|uniref:Uncharacterized protein n=1 Tax=Pleurotus eryngii TaxID=5323 RepID=A0A9P6D8W4_PLEER|nr:hypothetical protein BDN71DRAFT_543650 [Pleurotus eryngii]